VFTPQSLFQAFRALTRALAPLWRGLDIGTPSYPRGGVYALLSSFFGSCSPFPLDRIALSFIATSLPCTPVIATLISRVISTPPSFSCSDYFKLCFFSPPPMRENRSPRLFFSSVVVVVFEDVCIFLWFPNDHVPSPLLPLIPPRTFSLVDLRFSSFLCSRKQIRG